MTNLKNHSVVYRTKTGGVKVAHNIIANSLEQAKEIIKRQIKVRKPDFGGVWKGRQGNTNFNQ